MKAGQAVFLHTNPRLRGNITRVTPDGVHVTWHKYIVDVPESLQKDSRVDVRAASRRTRVFYPKHEMKNVGLGVPQ